MLLNHVSIKTGKDHLLVFLAQAGVDRVSLGIQSLHEEDLSLLGRCSRQRNMCALAQVAERFDNFNVDVLLGVLGSGVPGVLSTLADLLAFSPPHLSVYCLEEGGGGGERSMTFLSQVDQELCAEQYLASSCVLEEHGYVHYEVSNFAAPGRECRHNWIYWDGGEYLGVGPGAHSYLRGRRSHNPCDLTAYLSRRDLGTERASDPVDAEGKAMEKLMLGLRTRKGVALEELGGGAGMGGDLVASGLAELGEGRLRLTAAGFIVLDEIVLRLWRRRSLDRGQYSSII